MSGDIAQRVSQRFRARAHEHNDRGASQSALDVGAVLGDLIRDESPLMSDDSLNELASTLAAQLTGYGALQPLLDSPGVTDVLVNGDGSVWFERNGRLEVTAIHISVDEAQQIVERMLGPLGQRVDRSSPIADGRLADGSRVNVVLPPVAVDGPLICIRRFAAAQRTLADFASEAVEAWLRSCLRERHNMVVYGGTGSGKTTLLNVVCSALVQTQEHSERIITIEDTAELRLGGDHVVRLETRRSNSEGVGELSMRDLIRTALRMRPDRIIVGEVRGAEALDMIWAMSTGHDGSLSTCHARNAADALRRLETFALLADAALPLAAIQSQVRAAVDVLVGVRRDGNGGRFVHSVDFVDSCGPAGLRPIVRNGHTVEVTEPNGVDARTPEGSVPEYRVGAQHAG